MASNIAGSPRREGERERAPLRVAANQTNRQTETQPTFGSPCNTSAVLSYCGKINLVKSMTQKKCCTARRTRRCRTHYNRRRIS
jgi:hypothetical protein